MFAIHYGSESFYCLHYSLNTTYTAVITPFAPPFQEAEQARKTLLELQAVAAAVESSGQAKAEAKVGGCHGFVPRALLFTDNTTHK